jgi:hypothetical protein
MPTLVNWIPNQYTQEGASFSYQFPADTFTDATAYTANLDRPVLGRSLPSWLTFTSATRTFSGTVPSAWDDHETTYHIVVTATGTGDPTYAIFVLSIGFTDNVGRPCYRSNYPLDFTLNAANLSSFLTASVTTGDWVKVAADLWALSGTANTKISEIRTNGGYIVWELNNTNLALFDWTTVTAGETVGLNFASGNIAALTINNDLINGLYGKEIYVTNIGAIGFVEDNTGDNPVLIKRSQHIRFIGQPADNTPYTFNSYGIGFKSTSNTVFRCNDGFRGNISISGCEVGPTNFIGIQIKTDLTHPPRRTSQNTASRDDNMSYISIRNCYIHDVDGEGIYIGGGFFSGRGGDGNRFYHIIEHAAVEWNIIERTGWDAIQMKCITKSAFMRYNYASDIATLNHAGQNFGYFFADGFAGEVAYNFIKDINGTGIRGYDTGLTECHHNLVIRPGTNDSSLSGETSTQLQGYYGAALPNPSGAPIAYTGQHSINTDIPTNLGYSPGYIARPDLTNANLYCRIYHNTFIGHANTTKTMQLFSDTPQGNVQNNLWINCGQTTIDAPSVFTKTGNLMLTGVTLSTYFNDSANDDYRLKAGASAIAAGVNISSYSTKKDYGNTSHVTATPSVGAFETGSAAWTDMYHYALLAGDQPPVVDCGADIDLVVSSTTITATASDPDGTIASYLWETVSGPNVPTLTNGTTATVTVSGLVVGSYLFRCTVTDNDGLTASDTVIVTVSAPTYTYHQWYSASDSAGAPNLATIATIPGATAKAYTPPTGQNKWFRRGTIPIAKTGNLVGIEYFTSWVNVP